ncbi:MAG: SDR family oxidoreductase [Verrucomicrobia bacterium]|nr:SDR family oxidoreductase [Verrucomicrobiota bacterium]
MADQTVLLTGASGGLGTHIAESLAGRGVKLGLVAFPGAELKALHQTVKKRGCKAIALASDLRDPAQRHHVIDRVRKELGEIEILINNAGVEFNSFYHELSEDQINEVINVNLTAAMILSRLVLPGMLERKRGHIVSISSLAGKSGPAFQEPYAASKAALVAFTMSLRASYRELGVSASVVTPGFVEAGIYANLKARSGCSAPRLLGASKPEAVAQAVVTVIECDLLEKIVNPLPVRPILALSALFPGLGEWIADRTGGNDFFRNVEARLHKTRTPSGN